MRSRGLTLGGAWTTRSSSTTTGINAGGLRSNEFVKHKILDAIGDM